MIRILEGDCRDVLQELPHESVHCVVTSPPYWGLRDYGTATWEGGEAGCEHRRFNGYAAGVAGTTSAQDNSKFFKDTCGICGARRIDSQIGLEPDFSTYIATMVEVFREVRRVLRKDGTLWLNLGDSYNAYNGGAGPSSGLSRGAQTMERPDLPSGFGLRTKGLKPKDLCGIPWRVAFALQADGWWLRQDIIWSKPNPMPESIIDRCTKAHEYIFLMSKNARYFYDTEAIKEKSATLDPRRPYGSPGANALDVRNRQGNGELRNEPYGRNKRSVWEIATAPFSEAHFATFPPALIEPCIKAGCPKGGTVLDPFGGAGTTGLVADRLGRNAILIELNSEYSAMAIRRIKDDAGMFAQVEDS